MKFLFLNKSQGYILLTLLCLIFFGSCYFFIYLPANEKKIEQQRFRTLQNIDRNIHEKMDNSDTLLNNLLKADSFINKAGLEEYINNYSTAKFSLSPIITTPLNYEKLKDTLRNPANIVVNNATRQISVQLLRANQMNNSLLQISLNYSFDQFITSLLPETVFDEYIVFSKGNIVYESFPSGISSVKEDSLLNTSNGINGSYVKDMTAGGKDYKIFLQTITFDSSHKWILGGMLSKSRYVKERSQLPSNLLLMMVTFLIIIVVIFPWIKLYQMGSKDRLTLSDGISSIVVAILMMSLLFFCFFKYNDDVRNNSISHSKEVLHSAISDSFCTEISKHYKTLKKLDSIRWQTNLGSIVNLFKDTMHVDRSFVGQAEINVNKNLDTATKKMFNDRSDSASIRQVFWLDKTGQEKFNWTPDRLNAPHNNFSNRNYFKRIIHNSVFFLQDDLNKIYALDQVVSRTSGIFTTVLAIPSVDTLGKKPCKVAAMTFGMHSLENVVLPTGYSFAVIDNSGKVLYHSIASRNLNENIQSEFSDSAAVSGSIHTHNATEFSTLYYGKSYYVRIAPIKNIPYSLVIFSDSSFSDTRDIEIYSFTFSMLVLFFIYMLILLFIIFLVSSRRSFFKKQTFDTSWVGPKTMFHKEYILSAAINVLIILLLIFCFKKFTFFQYLFLLLSSITLIALFQNSLFSKRYLKDGNPINRSFKQKAVILLSLLLIADNVIAFILLQPLHYLEVSFSELVISVGAVCLIRYSGKMSKDVRNFIFSNVNYVRSFSLMVITCLVITSGLPVAFFYKSSFNFEQNLGMRYRQINYADRIVQQPEAAKYFDTTVIHELPVIVHKNEVIDSVKNYCNEYRNADKVLSAFHLSIGEDVGKAKLNYLNSIYSTDSSIVYQPLRDKANDTSTGNDFDKHLINNIDSNRFVYSYRQTGNGDEYWKITSENIIYDVLGPQRNILSFLYWLFLLSGLIAFYFIINNIVKKIFCLNLPDLAIWKDLDDKILTDNELNKFSLIIGLPGAKKFQYIIDQINNEKIKCNDQPLVYDAIDMTKGNVYVADLINMPKESEIEKDKDWEKLMHDAIDPKYKMIIINHFEYNMQDDSSNLAKLQLLEDLMVKSKCKIMILSTIHPLSFLDSLNDTGANTTAPDATTKVAQHLNRWHVLMGHFRISIMPITKQHTAYHPAWHQLLFSETEYTHFLQDMQRVSMDLAGNILEEEAVIKADQLAYKLQVTSQYFYMYIWQSLTKEEKFLLYDLAEDNLVNSYDDYNLTMLLAKGVIIKSNGLLRLFNRGFRNFILTAIGNSEVVKIKERIKASGNWNNLKTPLMLVVVSILAFLLISQQEAYSKLLTYIAALSAGVPAVLKIFSMFDKGSSKSNV